MMDYRKILRMKEDLGLSSRQIAERLGVGKTAVADFLKRWDDHLEEIPDDEGRDLDNGQIHDALYMQRGRKKAIEAAKFREPDYEAVCKKLREKGQTLKRIWRLYDAEGVIDGRKPYSYRQFCQKVFDWKAEQVSISHITRTPGESMELDFAGKVLRIGHSGDKVTIFVATLSFSGYFYAEGLLSCTTENWIHACNNAVSFFGGVPKIVVVDNTKQAVIENRDWIEPVLNSTFQDWAEHNGTEVLPSRVRAPRWKPNVENSVGVITRDILVEMDEMVFFSIDELNAELLRRILIRNEENLSGQSFSRLSLFSEQEQPALLPLPSMPFKTYMRKLCKVRKDLAVDYDHVHYTMQRKYVGQTVLVKASDDEILIFDETGSSLIKRYRRSYMRNSWIFDEETEPRTSTDYGNWSPQYFLSWAGKIGQCTKDVIQTVLDSKPYPNQAYRSCLGIISLSRYYGGSALEACCRNALERGRCNYSFIKNTIDGFGTKGKPKQGAKAGHPACSSIRYKSPDAQFSLDSILSRQEEDL